MPIYSPLLLEYVGQILFIFPQVVVANMFLAGCPCSCGLCYVHSCMDKTTGGLLKM
jgi:hypothetical protein